MLHLERPIVFFDIESTGTDPATDKIVELAMMKIYPDQRQEWKVQRFHPGRPIPAEATMVHGISDSDVANCPRFEQHAGEINNFLQGCDLGGYNSNRFDIPMLAEEMMRSGIPFTTDGRNLVDVFKIFTLMERRDLTAAYKFYCSKELTNAHSAEADIQATYEVLLAQLQRYDALQNNVTFLHEMGKEGDFIDNGRRMVMQNGKPHFNFGKYKGQPVADVLRRDPGYYDWIQKSDFMLDTKEKLTRIKMELSGR